MSLFHAAHSKHSKHAKSDDTPDDQGLLLALALMRSRDAIVGTEDVRGQNGMPAALSPAERLVRLDPDHRAAILSAELLEDLSLSLQGNGPSGAQTATLSCSQAVGVSAPFVKITRPSLQDFQNAIAMVGHYAELRADRAPEIEVQIRSLLPFFAAIRPMEASRNPATIEMLDRALDLTTAVVMRIKLALACPRPTQFSDLIQPSIPCPSHASLPSGHATQAFCIAMLLTRLDNPQQPILAQDQLFRLACRIAVNRTVAGVHFPADSAAGAVLGIQLAAYLLARADPAHKLTEASFDGQQFIDGTSPRDFHYSILAEMRAGDDPSTIFDGTALVPQPAPLWSGLVQRARTERDTRWS